MLRYSSSPFTPDSLSIESSLYKPNALNNDVFPHSLHVAAVNLSAHILPHSVDAVNSIMVISRPTLFFWGGGSGVISHMGLKLIANKLNNCICCSR